MISKQKGFSAPHLLLILVVIAIIAGVGWYIYKTQKADNEALRQANNTTSTVKQPSKETKQPAPVELTTYTNDEYGLKFDYPKDWKVSDMSARDGSGGPVVLTSKNNTRIEFLLNLGGKGGDCGDTEAGGERTARTCTTVNNLQVEKLPSLASHRQLYFVQSKVTDAQQDGGKVRYVVRLVEQYSEAPKVGTSLQAGAAIVLGSKNGAVQISYSGKDDARNNTEAFYSTQEAKEVIQVFKTVRLLTN